jgi:hypothetical protein
MNTNTELKFRILDYTANHEACFIDENGSNCTEENAELFSSMGDAVARAEQVTPSGVDGWQDWAVIDTVA